MQRFLKFLNEKELAEKLNISIYTLRAHRQQGKGLPYRKLGGKILYLLDECLEAIEKTKVDPSQGQDLK